MKNYIGCLRVLISVKAILFLSGLVVSCGKEEVPAPPNPEVRIYAPEKFTVAVSEKRCTKVFDFAVDESGAVTGVGNNEKVLTVTAWNEMDVVLSGGEGFGGANAESSDTRVVSVERKDDRTYRLKYQSDGKAKIKIFNEACSISFNVDSKEQIPIEGLLLRYKGREKLLKFRSYRYKDCPEYGFVYRDTVQVGKDNGGSSRQIYNEKYGKYWTYFCPDTTWVKKGYLFEIVGIVPENTSWRNISSYHMYFEDMSDLDYFRDEGDADNNPYTDYAQVNVQSRMCPDWKWFPEEDIEPRENRHKGRYKGGHSDISILEGRKIWAYYFNMGFGLKIFYDTKYDVMIDGNEGIYILNCAIKNENVL